MGGGRGFRIWTAGLLSIAGGLLIIASGFSGHGFVLMVLGYVQSALPSLIGGISAEVASAVILFFALLIALGGVTVVLGGISILERHITLGRLLVMLGGGAGFLGLLITFGYAVATSGVGVAVGDLPYWVGVLLAVLGRRVAKGHKPSAGVAPVSG